MHQYLARIRLRQSRTIDSWLGMAMLEISLANMKERWRINWLAQKYKLVVLQGYYMNDALEHKILFDFLLIFHILTYYNIYIYIINVVQYQFHHQNE